MSKAPFWRPPQSAEVMRPMARVRVKGFPDDSPEAGALLTAFDGSLRNFYLRSAQAQSQSGLAQVRKVIDRGDHQLEYLHSSGQEIVTLAVHPQKIQEVLEEQKKVTLETWWDWAVLEIQLPAGVNATLTGWAEMRGPRGDPLTPSSTAPHRGVAVGGPTAGDPHPDEQYVFAATAGAAVAEIDDAQYASFLVDLRPARGLSHVVVDLYAGVTAGLEFVPTPLVYYTVGTGNEGAYLPGTEPHPITTSPEWPPDPIDNMYLYTAPIPWGSPPAYTFDVSTERWTFGAGDYQIIYDPSGAVAVFTEDAYIDASFINPYIVWAVIFSGGAYLPPGPSSADVVVTGAAFMGSPQLTGSLKDPPTASSYYRWDFPSERPTLATLGTRTAGSGTGTFGERYGLTHLGVVTIDLHTGGVSLGSP